MRFVLLLILLLTISTFLFISNDSGFAHASEDDEDDDDDDDDEVAAKAKAPKRAKRTSDWAKTNFQNLEKSWESGDEADELASQMDYQMELNRRKNSINWDDPGAVKKALATQRFGLTGGATGKMLFITLKDKQSDGQPWNKRAVDKLSAQWQSLLATASLTGALYNIGDTQMLINIEKSYMMDDIIKFILKRPDAMKVTIDNKDYFPDSAMVGLNNEDDDDYDDL